jgi:hypothetical protein
MKIAFIGRRRRRSALLAAAVAVVAAVAAGTVAILGATSALASTGGQLVGIGGKCVDVAGGNTADGTAVQIYTCNGTNAQQWTVGNADNSIQALGKCMDVTAAGTANGTTVQLYTCNGTNAQKWTSSNGELINTGSGKCLDATGNSSADGTRLQIWSCAGTANQLWTLPSGGGNPTPTPTGTGSGPAPDLGPNVHLFDTSMSMSSIQSTINSVYSAQQSNQFGTRRDALLFKPGSYNVDLPEGFNTQVAGLGLSPDDVSITGGGIHVDAAWSGGNATQNFWREAENFSVSPSSGTVEWAVSQADPFRRVDVHGNMTLDDYTSGNTSSNWSSGGYIGDSRVSGQVNSGTQQQFLTQDTALDGGWTGSNWNMVFVGDTNAPGTSFPSPPDTNVAQSPTMREKPFLYVDSSGNYNVFVPALRTNAAGPDWTAGTAAGTSLPISQFYIVKSGDTAATINAALSAGQNLLITPGVYHLSAPLSIARADTVVLGLGMATLVPDNGVTAITTADVNGVDLAGLLISAGTTNSATLVQIGPAGSTASHASDPTVLHDVFFRVGGDVAGKATQSLVINSADVIGDDLWIWRADHGSGVGWTTNPAANGLIVNGANVTMYGLAVEHYQAYQVTWNGNGGRTYFYQSEMPYDVPDNASWTEGGGVQGYASYKVGSGVTSHQAWGLGVYCYFSTNSGVVADNAIEVPGGTTLRDMVTVSLGGVGTINHVVNGSGGTVNSGNSVTYLVSYP